MADVTRGASNTIAMAETTYERLEWDVFRLGLPGLGDGGCRFSVYGFLASTLWTWPPVYNRSGSGTTAKLGVRGQFTSRGCDVCSPTARCSS